MFKNFIDIDPDPHQRGASTASKHISKTPPKGLLAQHQLAAAEKPYLKRLEPEDMETFFNNHTIVRLGLPENQKHFMKELKPELLNQLMKKNMPVIGMFVGDEMVSGCAVLYPADKDIKEYLAGYDFGDKEKTTAVISAVWTLKGHGSNGYSKKAVSAGMEIAFIDGKDTFRAKVDKENEASLRLFKNFTFDTAVEGENPKKVYPILAL